ncbi:hypothetical protein HK405_012249, partial [Cladochytrium tenue]
KFLNGKNPTLKNAAQAASSTATEYLATVPFPAVNTAKNSLKDYLSTGKPHLKENAVSLAGRVVAGSLALTANHALSKAGAPTWAASLAPGLAINIPGSMVMGDIPANLMKAEKARKEKVKKAALEAAAAPKGENCEVHEMQRRDGTSVRLYRRACTKQTSRGANSGGKLPGASKSGSGALATTGRRAASGIRRALGSRVGSTTKNRVSSTGHSVASGRVRLAAGRVTSTLQSHLNSARNRISKPSSASGVRTRGGGANGSSAVARSLSTSKKASAPAHGAAAGAAVKPHSANTPVQTRGMKRFKPARFGPAG